MNSARVLVIEDHAASLELVCYLLWAFGHLPFAAATGQSALILATQCQPDLVLCDIQLPDIDGYEVVRRLRAEPSYRSLPIIAVTALARESDRAQVLAGGFDGYFSKPIDPQTFVAALDGFLAARRDA